jgi:hypothetical protein
MGIKKSPVNFLHSNLIMLRPMTFLFQAEMASTNKFYVFGIFNQFKKE